MTLGDLFIARRAVPFLRGHDERRQRAQRVERRLVSFLAAICSMQILFLVIAIAI